MSWPTVKLGEVAEVKIGPFGSLLHKSDYREGGVPLVNPMHIINGGIVPDLRHAITREKSVELANYRLAEGDVILGRRGEMGRCAVVRAAEHGFLCGTGSLIVRPGPSLSSDFLSLLLSSPGMVRTMERASLGTTMPNLNQGIVEDLPIPLPPHAEQRRIAAILDQADTLRDKRRQVITYFGNVVEATFLDVFGDDMARANASLGELAVVSSGITKGRRTSEPTQVVPYLAVANVQASHLNLDVVKQIDATDNEIKRYALADGDVLLTEGGDPDKLGRGTVWRNQLPLCIHQNHIFRVRIQPGTDLDSDYLSAYIASLPARSYFLRAAKQTTGIASINMSQLKALPVFVPSRRRQETYLQRTRAANSLKDKALIAATVLDQLFASLQSRSFSGQL